MAWKPLCDQLLISSCMCRSVPDEDVAQRLQKYFFDIKFSIKPHFEPSTNGHTFPTNVRTPGEPLRVAILGIIGPHKGSRLLLECARDAANRQLPIEFVIFGYINHKAEFRTLPNVTVTGLYKESTIYTLLKEHQCHISFFPAVWPETYSYTLSIAMKANLLPVAFDFGAISHRIKQLGWGKLLELELMKKPDLVNDALLSTYPFALPSLPNWSQHYLYPDFINDYYELPQISSPNTPTFISLPPLTTSV